MKKALMLVVLLILAYGAYRVSTFKLDFSSMAGETQTLARGDLTIPINATGEIEPLSRHQIKSEASGEIIAIYFQPGEMVHKGDLLIRLNKDEEQRSVDRARAEVNRTRATLDSAKTRLRRLQTVGVEQAKQRVEQIRPQVEYAAFQKKKFDEMIQDDLCSPDEHLRVTTQYDELQARLRLTEIDLADAQISIELAEQEVTQAEAFFDQAETALQDAEKRLAETDIVSPVDGMIVEMNTQVGEVIQGGKTTFSAGTMLAIVANVSKVYVRAHVDEADIGVVRDIADESARPGGTSASGSGSSGGSDDLVSAALATGTPVKVHVEAFRDEEFEGVIERIHPEPSSRVSSVVTYRVDIVLTSENRGKLMAGMQADVEFTAQAAYDVVLVPHEAIRRNDVDVLGVYVPEQGENSEDVEPKFVPCRIGLDNGMYAEVLDGPSEVDVVYTVLPRKTKREQDEDDD